ncbi:MAG: hypothetical protein NVSMB65_14860 [Chloroflexota bacterium]
MVISTDDAPAASVTVRAAARQGPGNGPGRPGLRFYSAVAQRSFRRQLAYRASNLAGLATNMFWGVIRASIFTAIFMARPHAAGMTLPLALTYGWITEGLLMITWLWGWTEVAEAIRMGDVASDMARPYNLQTYWLARDLGRAFFHVLFRGLPVVAVGACTYPFVAPADPGAALVFLASVALGTVVSFGWRFLINVTAFWTTDIRGVGAMAGLVAVFFSGEQAPLAFYPGWLRHIAAILPFQAMIASPLSIYLGRPAAGALVGILATQVAWGAILLAAGRYLLARGYRKVEINGG